MNESDKLNLSLGKQFLGFFEVVGGRNVEPKGDMVVCRNEKGLREMDSA